MALLITNAGDLVLLPITLGKTSFPGSNWNVHLYQNNYTPIPTSAVGDFTECSFAGYASQVVDRTQWTSPTIISNRASMTANNGSPFTWTNGGSAQTVYGYYVTDAANAVVIYAELFGTSRTLNTGDELDLILPFTGGTQ